MASPLDSLLGNNNYLSAKQVDDIHRNADRDKNQNSLHHTLGTGRYQSAAGDHIHDGSTGAALLDDVIIEGNLNTQAGVASAVTAIAQALEKLGAANNTVY